MICYYYLVIEHTYNYIPESLLCLEKKAVSGYKGEVLSLYII